MADDYFTKAEKIKQKVRNLDWEKKIKLLEKDFEDKKFSKEEFLEKKRQVYSEVLDKMSEINQEKIKLNKDHSAEPIEDDYLSDEELEIFQEQLTPFQYMSLTKDYLVEFDSLDIDFSDDFRKFKNLENFVHWECVKKIEKLRIHSNYFSSELMSKDELVIKDIACLNKLDQLEEIIFDDDEGLHSFKTDYFSSSKLPNIKKLVIYDLWDFGFLQNFENLTDLTLYLPDDSDKVIKNADLSSLKNLKTLKLGNLEEKTNLEMINTLINVEELTLHSYLMEDFINLKPILELKKLKRLKIDGYVNFRQEDIQLISDMDVNITQT